ncbi:MAG: 4-(cytidine 5'-diphospho)-2-C-methyl-D-erythritol kinase [Propionibacteriaceae bacterium]|jgi:4-diphosphocytidyl-2-C-methyl-D-erythritol kinase|nr:4-(cytidine 5'-diphospho)-2-C-methyl-D-erythritol kinase [Propionibacteriaceae bacterium]
MDYSDGSAATVRVPGKINLALRCGPRRPDGYHSLATVFQAVSVFDEVSARRAAPGHFGLTIRGSASPFLPEGDDNLAIKAARLLARWSGYEKRIGVELVIDKAIPVAAGMAGGSADAAATLLACTALWDLDADHNELAALGAELGADVPFCLRGQVALGVDRGDNLAPVLTRGTYHWVLAIGEGLSTAAVFARFDEMYPGGTSPLEVDRAILNALAQGNAEALGAALVNDLQPAALNLRPDLVRIRQAGLDLGALGAVVSGSGPTIAFLCADETAAIDICVGMSSMGVGANLLRVYGPVPGARLLV